MTMFIVIAIGIALSVIIIILSYIIGPRKKDHIKLSPYECGLDPIGDAHGRLHIKFFLIAILFIIFDLDGISIIPWAVLIRELGWYGMIEIGIFVFFMLFALLFAIRKDAFKWE